jgi:hypothetical protein
MANQWRTWNVPSSIQEAAPDTGTGTKTTELAKSQNELQLSFSQTSQPIMFQNDEMPLLLLRVLSCRNQ